MSHLLIPVFPVTRVTETGPIRCSFTPPWIGPVPPMIADEIHMCRALAHSVRKNWPNSGGGGGVNSVMCKSLARYRLKPGGGTGPILVRRYKAICASFLSHGFSIVSQPHCKCSFTTYPCFGQSQGVRTPGDPGQMKGTGKPGREKPERKI